MMNVAMIDRIARRVFFLTEAFSTRYEDCPDALRRLGDGMKKLAMEKPEELR
jgi:hypothetical protein